MVNSSRQRHLVGRFKRRLPQAALAHLYSHGPTSGFAVDLISRIGTLALQPEIAAYIDDDASPDPHWLTYLAVAFQNSSHAGIGGPNIAPTGDGHTAHCVAHAPGNPVHILLSDQEAEHIPGCNMAFRKACLQEIGGFDPNLRVAGDDCDLCWRLQT